MKISSTSIGFDPRHWQTIIIDWSQWTGMNRCSQHRVKINRLFFTQAFVSQQTDFKQYSKTYWKPMKRTKQWNTASKWRRLCHQAGQLILYTLKPCEVNVSNTIQKWITIIKTTGHESSSKQFCTTDICVALVLHAENRRPGLKLWMSNLFNVNNGKNN